jgi:uncharacterized protein (UPF0305 family)
MVKSILTDSGFIEGKTFKETRFLKPPKTSYAIYLDNFTRRGGDSVNLIKEHNYAIELYSYTVDSEAESRIEQTLDKYALEYAKSERYWLETESLYQVVYTFDHIEK